MDDKARQRALIQRAQRGDLDAFDRLVRPEELKSDDEQPWQNGRSHSRR